jgi:hypothetical protein
MGHLRSDEFVDLADGTRDEASVPHLGTCSACRRRLQDLRAMLSAASELDVPEPSPLFWDHLSARVHDAVAAEAPDGKIAARWRVWSWPRLALPVAGAAAVALVLAVMLASRGLTPAAPDRPVPSPPVATSITTDAGEDPSLSLVAALVAQMDWDAASEVEVTTHAGAMDEAIGELSDGERVEMKRLLQQEIARPGA